MTDLPIEPQSEHPFWSDHDDAYTGLQRYLARAMAGLPQDFWSWTSEKRGEFVGIRVERVETALGSVDVIRHGLLDR